MAYSIDDSLNDISERSMASIYSTPSYTKTDTGSQYSFLPQYSTPVSNYQTGVYNPGDPRFIPGPESGTVQVGVLPPDNGRLSGWDEYNYNKNQMGSSSGGGMSSMYGGKSYADYPTIPMPKLSPIETPDLKAPELPVYSAPERDEKRLQALQQKAAAPGLQRLRRGLDKGIQSTRSIDNPTERKFHLSGMLEQYGFGLGDIISKADMTGLNEYEREYATQLDQAKTRYGADVSSATSKANVENQNLMNAYQAELADRNAMFNLQSQMFAKQPISRIAEAYSGSGAGLNRLRGPLTTQDLR